MAYVGALGPNLGPVRTGESAMPATGTKNKTLLCPVPWEHMRAALATDDWEHKVAFGSQVVDMFYNVAKGAQKISDGTRVLIYVSRSGGTDEAASEFFKKGTVTYEAVYTRWRCAVAGEHPYPKHRPGSTLKPGTLTLPADTAFKGFWEVSGLSPCNIKLEDLRGALTGKKVTVPRRPMYVDDSAV
jgi:hypothetical protein